MSRFDYDLLVIGAGSAGVRAARLAAGTHGKRVAIVEQDRVGGTCVLRGCVPKKLYVQAARYAEAFEDAVGFGWTTDNVRFDWPTLRDNVAKDVEWLSSLYLRNMEKAGVELIAARAVLQDAHTVRLGAGDRTVTAETILIATGGHPYRDPAILGIDLAITSDDVFGLEKLPKRILAIGGGYIALEFAGFFAALGIETTILHRGDDLLRGFDAELRKWVHAGLERHGVEIVTGDVATRIAKGARGLEVETRGGRKFIVDQVLAATGRRPNTAGIGLEAAGVETEPNGAIKVDRYSQTSVANIYAVGDVTDRAQLTPVAIREAVAFIATVYGGRPTVVEYQGVPTAVFTEPEVGSVGLSEADARAQFPAVDIYRANFKPLPNRVAGRDERMLIKLVVDAETDRMLGCHFVGPSASELVQAVAIAVKMGATKADFDATTALHPTLAEEIVTMGTPDERHRRPAPK
jgi:glutathione reductase (NADPH)